MNLGGKRRSRAGKRVNSLGWKDHPPIGAGWCRLTRPMCEAEGATILWPEEHRRHHKGYYWVYGSPIEGMTAEQLLDIIVILDDPFVDTLGVGGIMGVWQLKSMTYDEIQAELVMYSLRSR